MVQPAAVIQLLDPHVVNQIAAGEVVDRPASVVKELVENALDAGATRIDVRVEEGGKALIEVADDGWGMGPEDLERAFLSHATSKVTAVEDLTHVGTLGFRGEALASIGSVSRARIVSRTRDAASGHRVDDVEGSVSPVVPAAASPGTVVRVENLFAHVPARRKFLRTPGTEMGHINELMSRFALAFPHVAFRLAQGKRVYLECASDESRLRRIDHVHGADIASQLLPVSDASGEPTLEAYIGPPTLTRRDGRLEQVFLNGRHVRDRTVMHAIREAYRDLVPPGGHRPIAFVFLSCDPALVDVNVHPAKAEVRWRDGSNAHRIVRRALRNALQQAAPGKPIHVDGGHASVERAVAFAFEQGAGRSPSVPFGGSPSSVVAEPSPVFRSERAGEACTHDAATSETQRAEHLRPLAQALGTYLVLETEDAIVLVDQHALHERVLFDQINTRLREKGNLEVQRLLMPLVVDLGAAATAQITEEADLLETLGWIVEPFGEDSVAVQGVPAVLRRPDPEAALRDILDVLQTGRRDGLDRTDLVSATVDSLACRSAVMAGDPLHPDEVMSLLEQAEALDHSHSCPHGRPTRLTLSRGQLERWFHRTV